MRDMGVRGLLVFYADYQCSHSIAISGDPWPDDLRLSDIEQRFVCEVCGRRGAEVLWFSPAGLIWRNDFPSKAA